MDHCGLCVHIPANPPLNFGDHLGSLSCMALRHGVGDKHYDPIHMWHACRDLDLHGCIIAPESRYVEPTPCLQAYDLVRPTMLPLHNYDKYREALEAEQNVTVDRNAWKRREWRLGEDAGWDSWEQASLRYFRCALAKLPPLSNCAAVTAHHEDMVVLALVPARSRVVMQSVLQTRGC